MEPVVILGTGLAGYTTARELRKLDPNRPLVMVSADDGGYYSKPTLSNALAQGKTADSLLLFSADQMAEQLQAEVLPNLRVSALDPKERRVQLGPRHIRYGQLVLALGADPTRLTVDGDGIDTIVSVNDRQDYARLRQALDGKRRLLILGGGLIGCEFANDFALAGYEVTVLDVGSHPLGRLVPPEVGLCLRDALAGVGVTWHLAVSVTAIVKTRKAVQVLLSDGTSVEADAVLSAVGLRPRTQLAASAGLGVGRGIITNDHLETTVPDAYALGDCAEVSGLVLPFVMPLMQAARSLARTLAGQRTQVRYPAMPVTVKTPSCPVAVAPPPTGASGSWQTEVTGAGLRALFHGPEGNLLGFALAGDAARGKQALAGQLPATLT